MTDKEKLLSLLRPKSEKRETALLCNRAVFKLVRI